MHGLLLLQTCLGDWGAFRHQGQECWQILGGKHADDICCWCSVAIVQGGLAEGLQRRLRCISSGVTDMAGPIGYSKRQGGR